MGLDGSEYKKTHRRPGLCPDPAEGAYSAPTNPIVGGEGWLSPPQEPHSLLSALRASPFLSPTPKLVPTPLIKGDVRYSVSVRRLKAVNT